MNMFLIILVKSLRHAGAYNASDDLRVGRTQYAIVSFVTITTVLSDHNCVQCPPGTYNASEMMPAARYSLRWCHLCENEYVSNHICQACPAGTYNAAGDPAIDDDTVCDDDMRTQ